MTDIHEVAFGHFGVRQIIIEDRAIAAEDIVRKDQDGVFLGFRKGGSEILEACLAPFDRGHCKYCLRYAD